MRLAALMGGVALVALMAQPGLAQNQDTTQPPAMPADQTQQLAQADMDFAKTAAAAGMAEVELGKLATQQGETDPVKQFGQRMVDDHSQANDKLKAIAEQKGIDLPQEPSDEAQQAYDDLKQKSGQEFDQAFMDTMVKDHHKAVDLFQQEAESGEDADLQTFAEAILPTLQEHLDLAEQTQSQVIAAAGQEPATTGQLQPGGEPVPAAGDQSQAMAEQPPAATEAPQGGAVQPMPDQPVPDQQQAATEAPQSGAPVLAKDVIGSDVVNSKGDEVGEIKDLVIDANQVQYAVVSVGGFLGIGDKEVVIPLDQLKLGEDQSYLMTAETVDQLKQMPEYDKDQYEPKG